MTNDNAPEEIHGVSTSQFSVARYYGGMRAYDCDYIYNPVDDTLIRVDVLQRRQDERRAVDKAVKESEEARQGKLF